MPTPLDRPRLRPGLAAARDERRPVRHHPVRPTPPQPRPSSGSTAREFTWLQWLDGTNTLRDVQAAASPRRRRLCRSSRSPPWSNGWTPPCSSNGPRSQARSPARSASRRASAATPPTRTSCAPNWTAISPRRADRGPRAEPGSADDGGKPCRATRLRALLAPHIDYARGGVTYAWGYKELAERCPASLFVIVATSHYSPRPVHPDPQGFQTPLGIVPTDQALRRPARRALRRRPVRRPARPRAGALDRTGSRVPAAPVRPGTADPHRAAVVGSFDDCVETGTDPADNAGHRPHGRGAARAEAEVPGAGLLRHQRRLGPHRPEVRRPRAGEGPVPGRQPGQDQAILNRAEAADPAGYFRVIAEEGDDRRICGLPPTWLVLQAVRPSRGRVLHYDQYVHPRGSESVRFASAAFYA